MYHYKLTISYKGTNFYGWQKQPREERTVQNCLEEVLIQISGNKEVKTIASGRTDRGVHALGQVVKASINKEIPTEELILALNRMLDSDIRVQAIEKSEDSFHPIGDSLWKEYNYFFYCKGVNPILSDFVTYIDRPLDMDKMQKAAKLFIGKRDFCNYYTTGSDIKDTVRELYLSQIETIQTPEKMASPHGQLYVFTVRGNGFLKQMVRLIMGALIEVGKGKVSLEEIEYSFNQRLEKKLGAVAPPQGLVLNCVHY